MEGAPGVRRRGDPVIRSGIRSLLELMLGGPMPAGPERLFVVTVFTTLVGQGMWLICSALFLTRSVGLSPTQVGLALLVGGVAGLLIATPTGTAADWIGPKG